MLQRGKKNIASSLIGHANKYPRHKVIFLNIKAELSCKSLC